MYVNFLAKLKEQIDTEEDSEFHQFLESLNGFLIAVDKEGDLIYVSENVMKHLGISQVRHLYPVNIHYSVG